MAISVGKNPKSIRSRKKRESLLRKQQLRLEEQLRRQELLRQQEERRREEELAKQRKAELMLEELRLQELLLRESMERTRRIKANRRRGKRLWTAQERLAQQVLTTALLETAAASEADKSGYAQGWMPMPAAVGTPKRAIQSDAGDKLAEKLYGAAGRQGGVQLWLAAARLDLMSRPLSGNSRSAAAEHKRRIRCKPVRSPCLSGRETEESTRGKLMSLSIENAAFPYSGRRE